MQKIHVFRSEDKLKATLEPAESRVRELRAEVTDTQRRAEMADIRRGNYAERLQHKLEDVRRLVPVDERATLDKHAQDALDDADAPLWQRAADLAVRVGTAVKLSGQIVAEGFRHLPSVRLNVAFGVACTALAVVTGLPLYGVALDGYVVFPVLAMRAARRNNRWNEFRSPDSLEPRQLRARNFNAAASVHVLDRALTIAHRDEKHALARVAAVEAAEAECGELLETRHLAARDGVALEEALEQDPAIDRSEQHEWGEPPTDRRMERVASLPETTIGLERGSLL